MEMPTIYNQIDANRNKTFFIMFLFTLFIAGVVYIFALASGYEGPGALGWVGFALIIAALMNFISYYYSDKVVMAISGAKQISREQEPRLYQAVENLCIGAGMPLPKIYLIQDPSPNAFATGRDEKHAAVAVTTGLLNKLEDLELEGVIAHELSHIKNRDTLLMTIVVVLVGLVSILADWFLRMQFWGARNNDRDNKAGGIFIILGLILALIAPLIATLIQLAISRRREFLADASGALLTRYPDGLADALLKISQDKTPSTSATTATAHLYIINPFKDKKTLSWFTNLFNTHPPIEERVKALRAM